MGFNSGFKGFNEISNDDRVTIIMNFTTLPYLIVKGTFIPYHSYTELGCILEEDSHVYLILIAIGGQCEYA